jgi:saccharopine dehydrogenase-like NADP-dependent oxidoreductase
MMNQISDQQRHKLQKISRNQAYKCIWLFFLFVLLNHNISTDPYSQGKIVKYEYLVGIKTQDEKNKTYAHKFSNKYLVEDEIKSDVFRSMMTKINRN